MKHLDLRGALESSTSRTVNAWNDFWFQPIATHTLGAIRIGFGLIVVAWAAALAPDLDDYFFSTGFVPRQPVNPFQWGVFSFWTDDHAIVIGWVALLLAGVSMTLGLHSRLASVVVLVLVVSFQQRCPYIFNSGDGLLQVEALMLALAPTGAALSLDQRRRTGSFWSAQERAQWPIRLLQVQFTLIYVATFVVRMAGEKWPNGTALSYALRLQDMLIVPVPQWISTQPLIMNVVTWGVLIGELLIGVLVWNRRCRTKVLIAGLLLHAGIMVTIAVGFFSPAMFLLYLAFVPPETVRAWSERVRVRLDARRATGPVDDEQPAIARATT
jgi:hypothetical protein